MPFTVYKKNVCMYNMYVLLRVTLLLLVSYFLIFQSRSSLFCCLVMIKHSHDNHIHKYIIIFLYFYKIKYIVFYPILIFFLIGFSIFQKLHFSDINRIYLYCALVMVSSKILYIVYDINIISFLVLTFTPPGLVCVFGNPRPLSVQQEVVHSSLLSNIMFVPYTKSNQIFYVLYTGA